MSGAYRRAGAAVSMSAWMMAAVLVVSSAAWAQDDWQAVRGEVKAGRIDAARALVEQRLAQAPQDLDAHGWRARVLAWSGHWAEAELEYRRVLQHVPNDTDILCGLADVLLWQEKSQEALAVADRARQIAPHQPDILLRRARILRVLSRTSQARAQYREILALDPSNQEAKNSLAETHESRHELRVGTDLDTFNYTGAAQAESILINSRWTPRWSSTFGTNFYQRFGQDAGKFLAAGSFRFTRSDWLTLGGALARANGIVPQRELFGEYGHGFRLNTPWIKGLEASYQQHWFWYEGAHVLTFSLTQIYYLPHDCSWSLTLTGARSGFAGAGVEWAPSGSTRLSFPLYRRLSANLSLANGAETFARVDQIGRFAARTFAGGLKYRFSARQDISGYIAVQDRSQSRTQNSFGLSYGFRF